MIDRNGIEQALFDRLNGSYRFATSSRRFVIWDKVKEETALFLRPINEQWGERRTGMPCKVLLNYQVWVYASVLPTDKAPSITLNKLISAVQTALAPDPFFGVQNLAGAVQHAWIEGDVLKDIGDTDNRAKAVIPVRLLTTE